MGRSKLSGALLGAALCAGVLFGLSACTPAAEPVTQELPEPTTEPTEEPWGQGDPIPEEPELSPPTMETVTMTDPVAQSFTVEAPLGWDTTAYSTGMYSDHRTAVVSVSPDGKTILFSGDPLSPAYWSPSAPANQTEFVQGWVDQSSLAEWSEYQPATTWTEEWVLRKFGGLEGFELLGTVEDPDKAAQISEAVQQQLGGGMTVTAARTTFSYETGDGTVSGLVTGETLGNDQTWTTVVSGLSTLGITDDYEPMLTALSQSVRTTPEWKERQDQFWQGMEAQSQAFTQQLIDNHNANMAWIRNSGAAHQAKMQAIWAANDASMTNYYDRMASMDGNQRSFLNYLQGENTVQNSSGQTFQVAQGADVYYVNPSTGQTVGGNANFSEQDLRDMGLNPSDWTITEIVR